MKNQSSTAAWCSSSNKEAIPAWSNSDPSIRRDTGFVDNQNSGDCTNPCCLAPTTLLPLFLPGL